MSLPLAGAKAAPRVARPATERTRSFVEAVREATESEMARDPNVVVFGLDVDDPKGIQGTTLGLPEKFGPERVFGTPLSEAAMTAAKSRYMYGGRVSVPMVARAMIGKSWGQGAQHSQGLHSFFMHVPGMKVVAPSTPYDAKGCLAAAIRDDDPVVYVEHRLLHFQKGPVPAESYTVAPGKARVSVTGEDVTVVGISYMQVEALRAAKYLEDVGVRAEVIDPIWLNPLDTDTIAESVRKTGRLLVVDTAWTNCGAAAEIVARVGERLQGERAFRFKRMGFAPTTCPTTPGLEDAFYPNARTIAAAARDLVEGRACGWLPAERADLQSIEFKGPF